MSLIVHVATSFNPAEQFSESRINSWMGEYESPVSAYGSATTCAGLGGRQSSFLKVIVRNSSDYALNLEIVQWLDGLFHRRKCYHLEQIDRMVGSESFI